MRTTPLALRSRSTRSDRVAWAVVLAAALVAGLATPAWLHRRVRSDEAPAAGGRRDFRLPVLAYDRVGSGPGTAHVSAERIAEHLEALRVAGFHPVSLRQVAQAYRSGAPLPERPILLTFDGGHLSTYRAVDPLLRRLRWPAAMFVDARLPERRDAVYLYWDRLQRMVDSGLWDLGAAGPWREDARLLEGRLEGHRVLAAAPRQGAPSAAGEGAQPDLAFESALLGVNGARADPLRLARVRVPSGWSGRELVERLELSLAAPTLGPAGAPPPVAAARWVAGLGDLSTAGDVLAVEGRPRAEVWLAGSAWARDFVFEAEISPRQGPFWFVVQAAGAREQWRWGGTARALYLQRLRPGAPVDVLAQAEAVTEPGSWHSLRVVKRGGGVWVEWDGRRLTEPRPVPELAGGLAGLVTGTASEPGRLVLRNARFAAIPYRARVVSPSPRREELQALLAGGGDLAAISPPLLLQRPSGLERRDFDPDLVAMVAARGAWDVVPTVELGDGAWAADPARATELAELAAREGWAGLRLDAGGLGPAARQAWALAAVDWERAFERRGLRLVLDVDGGAAP